MNIFHGIIFPLNITFLSFFTTLLFASGKSKEDTVIADVYKAIVRIEVISEKKAQVDE